jgi:glycine cleavage system aminomethyltransferase T
MDYRAYLLDEDGHIVDAHTFVAASDQAALIHANQYANGRDVEVWHRSRRIGLIPREPMSIDPKR